MKDNLRYTILYVRISKDDDAVGDSNSITTQLAILQKYANDHAYRDDAAGNAERHHAHQRERGAYH